MKEVSPAGKSEEKQGIEETRTNFIVQWGALGSQWGINRTMAQIHALLMTAPGPMSTDEVMAELKISRGNAHANIKELIVWGLVRSIVRIGERMEYFEAEKDVWKIFTMVERERKRREIDTALEVLRQCAADTKGIKTAEGKAFHQQIKELEEFAKLASTLADEPLLRHQDGLETSQLNSTHNMEDKADKLSATHRRNLTIIGATALLPCLAIVITCVIEEAPEGLVALFPYAILHLVIWGLAIPAFERLPGLSYALWTLFSPAVAIGIMVFCKTGASSGWWWDFVTGIYAETAWVTIPISAVNSSITLWFTRRDRSHRQPLKGNHIITRIAYKLFG